MNITNNEGLNRLEVPVQGGLATLRYRIEDGSIWLLHVEVPRESEGRGIASELSRSALALAKKRNLKPIPVCSFVAAYVRRHPESATPTPDV